MNAKQLCKLWGLNVKHQLYRKDGTWFHLLTDFPGALLDENGYIVFETQADFENCSGLIIGKDKEKNWVNCVAGISSLPGYVNANIKLGTKEQKWDSEKTWEADVLEWLSNRRGISDVLAKSIIRFFELAFEHTGCVEKAWFGIHSSGISLVVGGIYLAALHRLGDDRGFWLLVDQGLPKIQGVEYRPVKSTQKTKYPLVWAHSPSFEIVPTLLDNHLLWASYAVASEKILVAPIAVGRDSVQVQRNKTKLSEILTKPQATIFELEQERLTQAVIRSRLDSAEARRERIKLASAKPAVIIATATIFKRNHDIVAEVLERAKGFCENIKCRNPAPFHRTSDNTPYLEVHHKIPLAQGGDDTVENAIALCPNCHREAHYGNLKFHSPTHQI